MSVGVHLANGRRGSLLLTVLVAHAVPTFVGAAAALSMTIFWQAPFPLGVDVYEFFGWMIVIGFSLQLLACVWVEARGGVLRHKAR